MTHNMYSYNTYVLYYNNHYQKVIQISMESIYPILNNVNILKYSYIDFIRLSLHDI